MMKNILFFIFCIINISILSCATQNKRYNHFINNLDDNYKGIYLSLYFINCLKETKNYSYEVHISSYIIVNKNITRYEYYDNDMYYTVSESKLINYQYKFDNNKQIISDAFGNRYIKISDEINNEVEIINIYIGKIVFDELIKLGLVYIENSMIRIPAIDIDEWYIPRFKVETFRSQYERDANLSLYDCKNNEKVYLRIIDGSYIIYKYVDNIKKIQWIIW